MSRLVYETVESVIYDPVAANRAATRAVLYALGFRHIGAVATLQDLQAAIRRRPPDLALCEAQGTDEQLCATIQELRQSGTAYNPFIVIIVTTWDKRTALANLVLDSGADDLVLRPFSTTLLRRRIESHIERRKNFVVTSGYVGPDRRSSSSRLSNAKPFEPPNSLRMKAKERLSAEEAAVRLESELQSARNFLDAEILFRDSFQIGILWRLMRDQDSTAKSYQRELETIENLGKMIKQRCFALGLDKAELLCDSVSTSVGGLRAGVDRKSFMLLLGTAAIDLCQAFNPGKSASTLMDEIEAAVAYIRERDRFSLANAV